MEAAHAAAQHDAQSGAEWVQLPSDLSTDARHEIGRMIKLSHRTMVTKQAVVQEVAKLAACMANLTESTGANGRVKLNIKMMMTNTPQFFEVLKSCTGLGSDETCNKHARSQMELAMLALKVEQILNWEPVIITRSPTDGDPHWQGVTATRIMQMAQQTRGLLMLIVDRARNCCRDGIRELPTAPPNAADCAVCWESTSSVAKLLPCGHSFHTTCLQKCFDMACNCEPVKPMSCPLCRDVTLLRNRILKKDSKQ